MSDKERLIELLHKAEDICDSTFDCDTCKYVVSGSCKTVLIADYLLANGVIVPPCKVGQTVYIIDDMDTFEEPYVLDAKVSEMGQDLRGMWIGLELPLGMRLSKYVYPNNLGKTVFLTKEEAERELQKRGEKV